MDIQHFVGYMRIDLNRVTVFPNESCMVPVGEIIAVDCIDPERDAQAAPAEAHGFRYFWEFPSESGKYRIDTSIPTYYITPDLTEWLPKYGLSQMRLRGSGSTGSWVGFDDQHCVALNPTYISRQEAFGW